MNRVVPTRTQSFIKGAMILTVAGIIIKIIGAPSRALNAAPDVVKPAFMNSSDQQE